VTVPDTLAAALADRYTLERVVGRGGMATVYLARDAKHNRQVAVKVLRPELAATLGVDRFLQEIEIAAQLNHPHVLPLLDSGTANDVLYYTMPFVNGESLRGLLNRQRLLHLETALGIAEEVADALSYAHRQGVLHRDIKPENILLSEGHAVVADFGIAKAISTAGGDALTRTGFPLGTPGYMSPEQAAANSRLDDRTDVFSLATVFYEMLVGETPGLWPTDDAVRLGRFLDAPADHREKLDRLPGSVEQALTTAMAMSPQKRFGTPAEFVTAIRTGIGDRKKFGDGEVKQILQEAAQSQLERPTEEGALSLGSVQQIGAQVGISPERVKDAVRALDAPIPDPSRGGIFGTSAKIDYEFVVDREIAEHEYETTLEEIRGTMGEVGRINPTLGKSLSWNSLSFQNTLEGSGRLTHIMVSPKDGKTKIRITEGGGVHTGLFVGTTIMGGILGVALGEALGISIPGILVPPALATVVGASYLASRAVFRAMMAKRRRTLSDLMRRLSTNVSQTEGESPTE
jgi:serine/threonine protein kinase